MDKYIWDRETNEIRKVEDLMEYAEWFQTADRMLARDEVYGVTISTVFLGLDHSFGFGREPVTPVLWETMCFAQDGNVWRDFQMRHTSREDALNAHRGLVMHIDYGGTPEQYEGEE
jgi:hypothetical protein